MHRLTCICLLSFVLTLISSLGFAQENCDNPISIEPTIPTDINQCSSKTPLTNAAEFAWQEFIALNWPAVVPGTSALEFQRETPDKRLYFGQGAANPLNTTPLVWETFRHKVEIFPALHTLAKTNMIPEVVPPPQGYSPESKRNGYDALPEYIYDVGPKKNPFVRILPCNSNEDVAASQKIASWINLDEMSELGLVSVHAGATYGSTSRSSDNSLIRYLAKANFVEYNYVTNNNLWYHSKELDIAQKQYKSNINVGKDPNYPYTDPKDPNKHISPVQFPFGTIEVKSAWRPLTKTEAGSGRFHQIPVRFYEEVSVSGPTCYYEETWGMIALHIIQKTPNFPEFVFATFEQSDNIQSENGPVEDDDGNITNMGVTTPTETYKDRSELLGGPIVEINGASYCNTNSDGSYNKTSSDLRLYFRELSDSKSDHPAHPSFPNKGYICVNRRSHPIERDIISVNKQAHNILAAYAKQNKLNPTHDMPFSHYKLVSVQAGLFDKKDIGNRVSSSTYYQANIVVETDYTLQNFSGRLSTNGPGTDYPLNVSTPTFKNVYHYFQKTLNTPAHYESYNSGGCLGCHGNAQLSGNDFSFLLDGNNFSQPETPVNAPEKGFQRKFYGSFLSENTGNSIRLDSASGAVKPGP